nr:hypothetical protein CFP56_15520 [Quercus suber]
MTLFSSPLYPPAMSLSPTPTISSASILHFSLAALESSTEPLSPRYLSPFNPSYIKNTTSHGVHKDKATLYIRDSWKYSVFGQRHLGSISYQKDDSVFSINGYWSKSSRKLFISSVHSSLSCHCQNLRIISTTVMYGYQLESW